MALSVVEVLLEAGAIDQDRLAQAFVRRYEPCRGYGAGMHVVLSRLGAGELRPGYWNRSGANATRYSRQFFQVCPPSDSS